MKKIFELINKNLEEGTMFEFLRNPQKTVQNPVITISREMGSGGRPIAYLVGKKLGNPWKVYHKIIVEEIAKETNLEEELVREVDESEIPVIDQIIDNVFGKQYLALSNYYKHLLHILATIGKRGHAIIIGRGANFLFPDALKVRIICEMDQRIKWIMKYEKVTKIEATKRIEASDKKRNDFTKTVFMHDQRKAHHYDLIIRTGSTISIDDAADIIVDMAKRKFHLH